MVQLNREALATLPTQVRTPAYDVSTTKPGIVHIGPGAFHRAHQAVYTDLAMAFGGDWRIDAVSMRSRTLQQSLAAQDGLYALVVLDEAPYIQVIGAIHKVLVLDDQRPEVMASLCREETAIITLTITEKGYCLDSQGQLDWQHPDITYDLKHPDTPRSAIGLIVAALKQRRVLQHSALTIISCDNLTDNGDKLGRAVIAFASEHEPSLGEWISNTICFPNTMVDSITPATDDALLASTAQQLGVKDAWPIQREAFTQWVIEDKFSGPRPAWDRVGVTFTDDVHRYEIAKLRILNGTHSTLAYVGSLYGFDTVYSAISCPSLALLVRRLLWEEILPTIRWQDREALEAYAESILTRYHNKHIRHLLSQIAWDGSQKIPFRILNTIRDRLAAGASIDLLAMPVAAWILFIVKRVNEGIAITDPMAEKLSALVLSHQHNFEGLVDEIVSLREVFSELSDNVYFRHRLVRQIERLRNYAEQPLSETFIQSL